MIDFEEIQTSKLITNFGGIGSLLETRNGCVMIEDFSEWLFVKKHIAPLIENPDTEKLEKAKQYIVSDERLEERLRSHFRNLKFLFSVPVGSSASHYYQTFDSTKTISGYYFPEWMYCPKCHRLDKFANWLTLWKNTPGTKTKDKTPTQTFHPPKCGHCKKEYRRNIILRQSKFVATAPTGAIADFPFDQWYCFQVEKRAKGKKDSQENLEESTDEADAIEELAAASGGRNIFHRQEVPPGLKLYLKIKGNHYEISELPKNSGEKSPNPVTTLRAVGYDFDIGVFHEAATSEGAPYKIFPRNGNNIYYPIIAQSIYIPFKYKITPTIAEYIKNKKEEKSYRDAEQLADLANERYNIQLTTQDVEELITNNYNVKPVGISESTFRRNEFEYLTQDALNAEWNDRLQVAEVPTAYFAQVQAGISRILCLEKITITSVPVAYSRQTPKIINEVLVPQIDEVEEDLADETNHADIEPNEQATEKRKKRRGFRYTSKYAENTYILPAIQTAGEGILFVLDTQKVKDWEANATVQARTAELCKIFSHLSRHNPQAWFSLRKLNSKQYYVAPRIPLLHTLSHLLIRELEFHSGFPASGMFERLYVDENDMLGILIYTCAGAAGSAGGLISSCDSELIGNLIYDALIRAQDCPADPVCYHTETQTAVSPNLAACFSCALLPEQTCEGRNEWLDRSLLVDPAYGFFKDTLQ